MCVCDYLYTVCGNIWMTREMSYNVVFEAHLSLSLVESRSIYSIGGRKSASKNKKKDTALG